MNDYPPSGLVAPGDVIRVGAGPELRVSRAELTPWGDYVTAGTEDGRYGKCFYLNGSMQHKDDAAWVVVRRAG